MVIVSYILTASLEGAIAYMIYAATGEVPLLYTLLFISSVLSIPIELSAPTEALRKRVKEKGQNLDIFDVLSNYARFVIYLAVWRGIITPDDGGLYACICIGVAAVLSMIRYKSTDME